MIIRHAAGFDGADEPRGVLLSDPELLFGLAIDHRRSALFDSDLVASFEGRREILGLRHIFAVCSEGFPHLVIANIFLEEMQAQCDRVSAVASPGAPGIVVVYDDDDRHSVFR